MRRRFGGGALLGIVIVVLIGLAASAFPVIVTDITFDGLDGVRLRDVLDVVEFRSGDEILESDLKAASTAIFELGFFREVMPELVGEGGVVFHVVEFPRIEEVVITGNTSKRWVSLFGVKLLEIPIVSTTKIKQLLRAEDIRPGKVLNRTSLEAAIREIINQYNTQGYMLVAIGNYELTETLSIEFIEGVVVDNVIEGLETVPVAAAQELIDLPIGEPLKQVDFQRVFSAISGSVLFSEVEVVPQAATGSTDVVLRWTLTERELIAEPVAIEGIDLRGVTRFAMTTAEETLLAIPTGPVDNYALLQIVEGLYDLYQDTGYVMVRFTPAGVADGVLALRVDEGIVSAVTLSGNTRTDDHVVLRNLKIEPGDILTRRALRVAHQRLNSFAYFGSISLLPEWSEDGVRLSVVITERNDLGGMNGTLAVEPTSGGVVGELTIDQRNLFGTGQDVSIKYSRGFSSDVEPMTSTWTLGYSTVAAFPGFDRVGLDLYRSIGDLGTVDEPEEYVTVGSTVSFDYPVGGFTGLALMYKHEEERLVGTDEWSPIDSVTLSLVFDNVDDPMFPMNGNHRSAYIEKAGGFAAGQEFTKLGLRWVHYSPLNSMLFGELDQAMAILIRAGLADEGLSLTQAFRLGGPTAVRGTEGESVSKMFIANFEHRVQLTEGLVFTTFLDAGVNLDAVSIVEALASTGFEFSINAAGMVFRLEFIWVLEEGMDWLPRFDIGFGPMF